MTRFELKKVFSRRINRIVLLVMAVVVMVCVSSGLKTVRYSVYDENAEDGMRDITGHAAAVRFRADAAPYEGLLTTDVLRRVIEDNARITAAMEQARPQSVAESHRLFTLTQGYSDIRKMCGLAYTPFNLYDYYALDSLRPEDADRFYSLRTQQLKDWFSGPNNIDWSPDPRCQFLVRRFEALETPMLYHPVFGWTAIFGQTVVLLLPMCLVLGFLLSGVFTVEHRLKTDSIFYSSYHGRKKAVWAKVRAGLIITNGVYWGSMLVLSAVLLLALGAQGWDCPIQITSHGWMSFYNITMFQKYLLTLGCGWVGISVMSMISMLISAKTNSATLSVAAPGFIILLTQIFASNRSSSELVNLAVDLLPQPLLQIDELMAIYGLHTIGEHVFPRLEISPWLNLAIALLLVPLVYQIYRKKSPA